MDVNDTRFHLLLGKDDWAPLVEQSGAPSERNLSWDEERASLSLRPLLFQFPTPPGDQPPGYERRRGAGRDRYGHWYWIDEGGTEIRILPQGGRGSEHFWSSKDLTKKHQTRDRTSGFQPLRAPAPPSPWRLSGLAVTEHHYLVVGVLDPPGLLVFDLHAGGPPTPTLWPDEVPFAPFDIAPAPGGGVWVLDREARRYWALDRYFRVLPTDQFAIELEPPAEDDFQPVDGPIRQRPGRTFPAGIALEMASPVEAQDPVAIEALPDQTVLIMDNEPAPSPGRPHSVVYRYYYGKPLGRVSLESILEDYLDVQPSPGNPQPYALLGHDLAFLPDPDPGRNQVTGTLFIVAADGNQTFALRLEADRGKAFLHADQAHLSIELLPRYFPMRLYSGKALVAVGGAVYYDLQERWLKLADQPRPRYRVTGTLETGLFDGKEPDCVWHRLFLDACIPTGTEVLVESRAANARDLLVQMPWQAEPRLYRRQGGPEVPYYQAFSPTEAQRSDTGTWELLFQHCQGRYLQLRLTLRGTGRSTPWLHALRVTYPRFSYLTEYLPAAYRYDPTSSSFLDRFLANFEGLYTVLEGRIAEAQTLFDVQTIPSEYLDWLAGWLGVVLDPAWEEARRRLFLAHAMELYNQRGTVAGLIRAIRLATDPCPDDTLFDQDVIACGSGEVTSCAPQAQFAQQSVRVVERFLTRGTPGVVYGDPSQIEGPGVTTDISQWSPDQGAQPLHEQFRETLRARYPDIQTLNRAWGSTYTDWDQILFSPVTPSNEARAADWLRFVRIDLGFTYAAVGTSDQDEEAYQEFLASRYRHVDRLNTTYQLVGTRQATSFGAIKLPGEQDMPSDGVRLYDWIQFVSLVLPIRRSAHRFSVLIPAAPESDAETLAQRKQLVQRIVDLEKPAHTDFDVDLFWALFRVGEARLGLDTSLGEGSRFVAVVIGSGHLAGGYLAPSHPRDVADRIVTGRDPLGRELEF